MYIYEKVRARNFARAWGFAQFSMSIPNAIGIPALGKYLILDPTDPSQITLMIIYVVSRHIRFVKIRKRVNFFNV